MPESGSRRPVALVYDTPGAGHIDCHDEGGLSKRSLPLHAEILLSFLHCQFMNLMVVMESLFSSVFVQTLPLAVSDGLAFKLSNQTSQQSAHLWAKWFDRHRQIHLHLCTGSLVFEEWFGKWPRINITSLGYRIQITIILVARITSA